MSHKCSALQISIHRRALEVSRRYRRCELDLIEVLQEVDQHRIYYKFNYGSLFQYAVKELGLSEEVTAIYINVARKAREVARISPRERMSYVHPSEEISEKVHLIRNRTEDQPRAQLVVGISEKVLIQLRRIQDLESSRLGYSISLGGCVEIMAADYLERKDPIRKAERAFARGRLRDKTHLIADQKPQNVVPGHGKYQNVESKQDSAKIDEPKQVGAKINETKYDGAKKNGFKHRTAKKRELIPAAISNALKLRDQDQCTYLDPQGKRCIQRRHLHIHHIIPVSKGGSDYLNNLITLCSGHHRMVHHH